MAQVTGSVLFIKADAVSGFPQVVQDFVEKYFDTTELFGVACFYAFRELEGACDGSHKKGIAPSHSVHLRAQVEEGITLYDWLKTMVNNNNQTDVFELTKYWDDGRYEECD